MTSEPAPLAPDDPRWSGVAEQDAPPAVAEVFAAIRETARVPYVGLFWRMLAFEPDLLAAAWAAVEPALRSWASERAAAALRDEALIVEAATIASHKAFRGDLVRAEIDYDLRSRIASFNAIAHYALSQHLLACALLAGDDTASRPASAGERVRPAGLVSGAVAVAPLDPARARGRAAELLPAIAAAHGWPTTEDAYRGLARLPDYLGAAWNALMPIVGDEEYQRRAAALAQRAGAAAAGLPFNGEALGTLTQDQRDWLRALAGYFQRRVLPEALIDMAIIKTLTDGPEEGPRSPFALA